MFNIISNVSVIMSKPVSTALIFRICKLIFLFSLIIEPPVLASGTVQESRYVVNKFSMPKEYNNSELFDLVRDNDGFVFLATAAGLMEWDGHSFRVYNSVNTNNFLSDRIQNLYLTSENDLWIFRRNRHVTLKEGDEFETFELPSETGSLRMFVLDENEHPWLLTSGIVYRFNAKLRTFESFNSSQGLDRTHVIGTHTSGRLIFATDSGFWKYESNQLSNILPHEKLPAKPSELLSFYFTDDNKLFVGHLNGYFSFDLSTQELLSNHNRVNERVNLFTGKSDGSVIGFSNFGMWNIRLTDNYSVFTESNNDVSPNFMNEIRTQLVSDLSLPLMASSGGRLSISSGNRFSIIRQPIIDEIDNLRFIYSDNENTYWVGTMNGSIYQLREKSVTNIMVTPVGEIRNAYSIVEAFDKSMWYGCMNNGVFREHNGVYTSWNNENSNLPTNNIRYIYQSPADSTIYVSVYHDGLWRLNNNQWEQIDEINNFFPINRSVIEAMYYDPLKDRLFVGSSTGLLIHDSSGWRITETIGENKLINIKAIRASIFGELFIATGGLGITLLDSNDNHVWTITTRDGMASNYIRDIHFQSADTLWVATENNGINRIILDTNRNVINIAHLGISDGLSNSRIHRIISDELGYLWISSNYGIMASNIADLNDYLDGIRDYVPMYFIDENSGMLNPEANGGVENAGIKLHNGHIALPTQSGIAIIDPNKTRNIQHQRSPRPIIREIRSHSTTFQTNYLPTLTLPLGERDFTAYFQAPLFNDANYRVVRYKLNGVDQGWRRLQSNFEVWYSRISPGVYTLDVQIIAPHGTPEQTSIAIIVPSFLYERLWFQITAVLGGITLIIIGTRYGYGKKLEIDEIRRLVDLQTNELRNLSEEKSRFFASITHELKTPVAIIMSNIDLMITEAQESGESMLSKPVKTIQRNSYKLLVLTDTLLGIAKLQNKQIKLSKSPINIVEATELIVEEIMDLLSEKKLSLQWIIDPKLDLLTFEVDPQAWERIIVNLLSNAINFSPVNGTITIEIKIETHLLVEITDEGPGISEGDYENIFGYLSQGAFNKTSSGTGLGLFLVNELVVRHNGTIRVHNKTEFKKGACFRIELPLNGSDLSQTPSTTIENRNQNQYYTNNIVPEITTGSELHQQVLAHLPSLLIVDDSDDYRDYIVTGLQGNYRVTSVDSASNALKAIEIEKPELIISDVMMPKMSGFELIKTIRQMDGFTTIPVIFLTALDSDSDTHTGLSAGADAYLTKPVKHQVVKAQIQALLRRENNAQRFSEENAISNSELVANIKMLVYRHIGNKNLNIDMIADTLFISRATLYRKWSEENDVGLQQYILNVRLKEAFALIREKRFSVTDAASSVGFKDSRYFATVFKKNYGFTPSQIPHEK